MLAIRMVMKAMMKAITVDTTISRTQWDSSERAEGKIMKLYFRECVDMYKKEMTEYE